MNLYLEKHTVDETELCVLERYRLFGIDKNDTKNYFFTEEYIPVDYSPFVKYCLKNLHIYDHYEELLQNLATENFNYQNFKVKYLDIADDIEFQRRHEIEGEVGWVLPGYARVDSPEVVLGVTRLEGQWMIGEYEKNNGVWRKHMQRPQGYCNALTSRSARAIVNIAAGNEKELHMIDPCCGIGTVVMEALSMGHHIVGSDINDKIAAGASRNLEYFGYAPVIKVGAIQDVEGQYDRVILDLPYGILSIADISYQQELIQCASRLGRCLTLISIEDMSGILNELSFHIEEYCIIAKGNFKRNLYYCIAKD